MSEERKKQIEKNFHSLLKGEWAPRKPKDETCALCWLDLDDTRREMINIAVNINPISEASIYLCNKCISHLWWSLDPKNRIKKSDSLPGRTRNRNRQSSCTSASAVQPIPQLLDKPSSNPP